MTRIFCFFLWLGFLGPAAAQSVSLLDAFPALPAFEQPVNIQHAGDGSGRLYIVERAGLLLAVDASPQATQADTVLDLHAFTASGHIEQGLLGLAFHPEYETNRQFFLYYTPDGPQRLALLVRFTHTGAEPLDPASGETLLAFEQPSAGHNGGHLAFGPDGYLYLSLGDGKCCGDEFEHGQNPATLLGSILRLDVDATSPGKAYAIPPDNPFVGNTNGWREEIFAYGFRNPWRFAFDPEGRLFAADVGEGSLEEINYVEAGKNYGWDVLEGFLCHEPLDACDTSGLTLPIHAYLHDLHGSITGGPVARGFEAPSLAGKYIFGDFVSGFIWALEYIEIGGVWEILVEELFDTDLRITTFGEDEVGQLYVADLASGRIYRFEDVDGPGQEPDPALRFSHFGPNPFQDETAFLLKTEEAEAVRIDVFDVRGRRVATLFDGTTAPGVPYRVAFDGSALPSGMYLARLESGARQIVRTVVALR